LKTTTHPEIPERIYILGITPEWSFSPKTGSSQKQITVNSFEQIYIINGFE
jgi:hypothetical protein